MIKEYLSVPTYYIPVRLSDAEISGIQQQQHSGVLKSDLTGVKAPVIDNVFDRLRDE